VLAPHRVFCLRAFFCRVYVQLRVAENAAGACKCARPQCASIAPAARIYMRAIRFTIFQRDCLFLPAASAGERALFSREEREKEKRERETVTGEHVPSTSRDARSLRITPAASRVETSGATFCNYSLGSIGRTSYAVAFVAPSIPPAPPRKIAVPRAMALSVGKTGVAQRRATLFGAVSAAAPASVRARASREASRVRSRSKGSEIFQETRRQLYICRDRLRASTAGRGVRVNDKRIREICAMRTHERESG